LERALTLNDQLDDFLLYGENEEELRLAFKQSLMNRLKQADDEEKAQQEVLGKLQREEREKKAASEKWRLEAEERSKLDNERIWKADELVEQEMLQIAKAANERPVSMSPEEWDWYKKTGRTFAKRNIWSIQSKPVASYESTEEKIAKENRVKFKEKLLSHPIRGDHFIDGHSANWRQFILKWIKKHQQGDNLTVSINKLLNDMRDYGITFNQKDSNVLYLVKEFFAFYQTGLKKDLKRKININYIE
jgi:hypothetical protein